MMAVLVTEKESNSLVLFIDDNGNLAVYINDLKWVTRKLYWCEE